MANLTPLLLNGVQSTVQAGSTAIGSATATGINVATGDGAAFGTIGTNQFIPAVITDAGSTTIKEYVWITAISTDALTVTRQAEESSRFPASTTSIQAGYLIKPVASAVGLTQNYGRSPTGMFPRHYGYLAWTFDPLFAELNGAPLAGAFMWMRVEIPVSVSVTNVHLYLASAGSGLTANQNWAGLYDSTGAKIGGSADQSTAWAGATGLLTIPLTSGPFAVTGGASTFVWVALVANGTTRPQFANHGSAPVNVSNGNLAVTASRFVRADTSVTSLPASVNLSVSGAQSNGVAYWAALS